MNWKEISEKYPKGLSLLLMRLLGADSETDLIKNCLGNETVVECFTINYLTAYEDFPWNERNLYDFFDKNEIYIGVQRFTDLANNSCWQADVNYKFIENFNTRPEAEDAAFEKAFEILESKLLK